MKSRVPVSSQPVIVTGSNNYVVLRPGVPVVPVPPLNTPIDSKTADSTFAAFHGSDNSAQSGYAQVKPDNPQVVAVALPGNVGVAPTSGTMVATTNNAVSQSIGWGNGMVQTVTVSGGGVYNPAPPVTMSAGDAIAAAVSTDSVTITGTGNVNTATVPSTQIEGPSIVNSMSQQALASVPSVPVDNRKIAIVPELANQTSYPNIAYGSTTEVSTDMHGITESSIAYVWLTVPFDTYSLQLVDKTIRGGNSAYPRSVKTYMRFEDVRGFTTASAPVDPMAVDMVRTLTLNHPESTSWLRLDGLSSDETKRDYSSATKTRANSVRLGLVLSSDKPFRSLGYKPVAAFQLLSTDGSSRFDGTSVIAIAFDQYGYIVAYSDSVPRIDPKCDDAFKAYNDELRAAVHALVTQPLSMSSTKLKVGGKPQTLALEGVRAPPLPRDVGIQPADGAQLVSPNLAYYVPRAVSSTAGPIANPIVTQKPPTALVQTQYTLGEDKTPSQ